MREARRVKPIIAVIDCNAASAAYWLASQANEIVMTPSSQVGSVGVFCLHVDASQALDRAGIRPTYIFAGQYKVEGNSEEPLADSALQHLQSVVDRTHDQFISDIVMGRARGLTTERVRKHFGEGRMVSAEEAITRGMADRLFPTLDLALNYAASYPSRLALKADLDHVDGVLFDAGDRQAIDRISKRAAAFSTAPVVGEIRLADSAQLQADRDYADCATRIAERL
jgi:ClpP class serine protease